MFAAIDPRACRREPLACAAIQRVLEKEPTLTFDTTTGRFRHAYSFTPPLPPPPPSPPPRLVQYNIVSPPPPPPPPAPPPPWYERLEQCVPTITPAEAGIDTSLTQTDEERALCLYVRALTDERVPATRCFSTLSPFPPPPPPTPQSTLAAIQTALRRAKLRRGGTSGADPTPPHTDEEEYIQQHLEQNQAVNALLDRLSAENLLLRDVLSEIRSKLPWNPPSGRRLFERLAGTGTHLLEQSIKTSELSVGNGALLGLTVTQCSTLCTALKNETDALHSCNGIMFRFLEPDNAANLDTAYCYLLKVRFLAFRIYHTRTHTLQLHVTSPMCFLSCAEHGKLSTHGLCRLHLFSPRHFWLSHPQLARQPRLCPTRTRPRRHAHP